MTDTVAILTGASRGLGAALARALLARPDTLLITVARHADAELDTHARDAGARVQQHQADLSNPDTAEQLAQTLCAALPRDAQRYLLINNAGTLDPVGRTDELTDAAQIACAFNLNVVVPMLLTARFLAATRDLSADRRVLNISSGAGRNPRAGWGVYCATKAALDMATRVAMQEHDAHGARLVSLAPGIVDTDMQAHIRASDPSSFPGVAQFQAFHTEGKLAAPDDVAQRILAYLDRDDFGQTEIDDIRNF